MDPPLRLIYSYEIFYTAVIGVFYVIRKITGGKLSVFSMVTQTFTTHSFSRARFICTVTHFFVFFYFTFRHNCFLNETTTYATVGSISCPVELMSMPLVKNVAKRIFHKSQAARPSLTNNNHRCR